MKGYRILLVSSILLILALSAAFSASLNNMTRFSIKWIVTGDSEEGPEPYAWITIMDYTASSVIGDFSNNPEVHLNYTIGRQKACTIAYITNYSSTHTMTISRPKGFVSDPDEEGQGLDFKLIVNCGSENVVITGANESNHATIKFSVNKEDGDTSYSVYLFPIDVELSSECLGAMKEDVEYYATVILGVIGS